MSKGGGGGLFSSGASQETNALETRNLLNFAPFQQDAISSVFNALEPSLLGVPLSSLAATDDALSSASGLLGQLRRLDPLGDLESTRQIISEGISLEPFNESRDRFEAIFRNARDQFGAELERDPTERVISLLLPTAEGRFLPGGDLANRFFEGGVVQPALEDARNQIATLFAGAGRLNSPSAAQTVARESGRIAGGLRSNQFNLERGNQLNASQAIGTFDANEAIRRLNTITGQANAQLAATQGLQSSIAAEEQRRQNLLNARAAISGQQLGLQQSLQSQLPQLAIQQTSLPFLPLSNFSNIAFQPLGQSGTIATQSETEQTSTPSVFSTIAGTALTAAGLGGFGGKGGTLASTGVPGFGAFGTNLGPLSGIGNAPPIPTLLG